MVKLDGQASLSVCVEQLLGAEATPRSRWRRPDVVFVGGAGGYHLLEAPWCMNDWGIPCPRERGSGIEMWRRRRLLVTARS